MKRLIVGFLAGALLFGSALFANDFYNHSGAPATGAPGSSAQMRSEFSSIATGFDKLPALAGNGNRALVVNAGGTAIGLTTGTMALAGNFTISGAFATTLTVTNTTTLTLPTTGTVATLAGAESFTNHTYVAPIFSGTATGSLTSLALTTPVLTGSISGTYTLAGTPTVTAPAISAPTFSGTAAGSLTNLALTTPALTGTVTGTYTLGGTPTITSTAAASGLTMNTARLLGRTTASAGAIEEITIGTGLTLATGSLTPVTATTTAAGIAELATQDEVNAGTATTSLTVDLNKVTALSAQATGPGTFVYDFTIPAGARVVFVHFRGVSLSGTDDLLVQLGDSGGLETSGYVSSSAAIAAAGVTVVGSTAGFIVKSGVAANLVSGVMTLSKHGTGNNEWIAGYSMKNSTTVLSMGGGQLTGMAALTTVRVTNAAGADTFDLGEVSVSYIR